MRRTIVWLSLLCLQAGRAPWALPIADAAETTAPASATNRTVRIGAAQPRSRLIDYRLTNPADALTQVDRSLGELEQIVHKAGEAKCDALAFPEDTLGLGSWEAAHKASLNEVLPEAVKRMLDQLGRAAASHRMYLVCCNDTIEPDGSVQDRKSTRLNSSHGYISDAVVCL